MRCVKCGKPLSKDTDSKVCSYCGTKVPKRKKYDITTIVLIALTFVLLAVLLYLVYDRFLDDKIKKLFSPAVTASPAPSGFDETSDETGNTMSNLLNGGLVTENNEYIFVNTINSNTKKAFLQKISKSNPEDKTTVIEGQCSYLNVTDDVLYFVKDGKLRRTALSGMEKNLVKDIGTEDEYLYVTIYGDWIYYCDSGYKLHRIRPDASEIQDLSDKVFKGISIHDGIVYGINEENKLVHINIDGKEYNKTDITCTMASVYSDWIYYSDGNAIYRALTDGFAKEKLIDVKANILNVTEETIYFFNENENAVYSMTPDGDNAEKLFELKAKSIFVGNNYLYILNEDDGLMYSYSIKDGGEPSAI